MQMSSGLSDGEKEIQDIVFKCILNVLIPRRAVSDRYRIVPKVYLMSDISYFQIHCCISR